MFKRKKDSDVPPRAAVQSLKVEVDYNVCYFCGGCVAVCPPDSIFLENAFLHIDHETCTRCERCVKICPVHALSMVTQSASVRAEGSHA